MLEHLTILTMASLTKLRILLYSLLLPHLETLRLLRLEIIVGLASHIPPIEADSDCTMPSVKSAGAKRVLVEHRIGYLY